MSKIKRSTYQRLAEENKRLKQDLREITVNYNKKIFIKWQTEFKKEDELNRAIKEACGQYFKKHPERKPPPPKG